MTISLLIPVFDYDIVALVSCMKSAFGKVPELCEIIIGDDGSSVEYRNKYMTLQDENVRVIVSERNIGRAAIRNKLALEAKGDFLLFIDSDTMITGTADAYFKKWLPSMEAEKVICGGIMYHDSLPGDPDIMLRWKYGKRREQRKASARKKTPYFSFSTFNVMIHREVFSKLRFNEEIKLYGHEDTLFGYQLKKAGIGVAHIDNGLYHEGLESNREFLNKTKSGIENLSILYDTVTDKREFSSTVRILKIYSYLRFFRLTLLLAGIFIRYRDKIELRIDSSDPPVWLFSVYKVCMFCTFREIHGRKTLLTTD